MQINATGFRLLVLFFIVSFFSWYILFKLDINSLSIQSEDTLPAIFLPVTIIQEKTLYLDSYYDLMLANYPHPDDKEQLKGLVPFYLRRVESDGFIHYVSAFPIVTPLLALPVFLLPIILYMPITLHNLTIISHIASSFIVALGGYFFYSFVLTLTTKKNAILLTLVYLFSTINLSLVSQALWQHGTVELFLILSLIFARRYIVEGAAKYICLFGFFASVSVLSRPTAALVVVLVYVWILYSTWVKLGVKSLVEHSYMLLGMLPAAAFFLWYNNTFYLSIANQGYANQASTGWLSNVVIGFLGLWFSPSKGIFIYSPIFIFIPLSVYILYKRKSFKEDSLYILSIVIVIVYTLVMGKWKHWYGGYSYGYRMAADIIPFLVLLLIPFIESPHFKRFAKIFYILLISSILIQISGLIFFDGIWHAAYDLGFRDTSWLWSLKDSEFAFNIRRILVKLGLLERACPQCL